jgi:integrase
MFLVKMKITFWRRKSKTPGFSNLYCQITAGGNQLTICSAGVDIREEHWNGERVTDDDPQAPFKNDRLDALRNRLWMAHNDLFRRQETITVQKIKREFLKQTGGAVTLISCFDRYIKDSRVDQERDLKGSSITVYDNVRKKLLNFLIHEKALDLLATDFDIVWLKKYRRWMKTFKLDGGKVGHADSYVAKHSQTIRNMLTWAKLDKLIHEHPLEGLRVKGAIFDDPIFLTEEQFQLLRKHQFNNRYAQQAADVFIVLCRCGFHIGDLKDFVKKYKTAVRTGVDGELWLVKDRIKTRVKTHVPQFSEVKQIIDKYGGWEKLPLTSDVVFNRWLKVIAGELHLDPGLSSKAGRKTFTDWCFNKLYLSTDSVMVLLGRKSSKGLEVYGRPDERRVAAELKNSKVMRQRKKK